MVISPDYNPKLLAASSIFKKPTIGIKRPSFNESGSGSIKLKYASTIMNHKQEEKEKAEKALRLDGL
jgi:hypothetical protein